MKRSGQSPEARTNDRKNGKNRNGIYLFRPHKEVQETDRFLSSKDLLVCVCVCVGILSKEKERKESNGSKSFEYGDNGSSEHVS